MPPPMMIGSGPTARPCWWAPGLRMGEAVALFMVLGHGPRRADRPPLSWIGAAGNGYVFGEPKTRRSRRTVKLPAIARRALETQPTRQGSASRVARLRPGGWPDAREQIFTELDQQPLSPVLVSAELP